MKAVTAPTKVQYRITPTEGGFHLCVWERATVNEVRVKPFLFKANYRVTSKTEAETILSLYLEQQQPHF